MLIGMRAIAQETTLLESVTTSDGNKAADQSGYGSGRANVIPSVIPKGTESWSKRRGAFS